ncbi:MAG: IPT/TIG domain-containing protein [Solirubrobacteraceae bacterium]|nr:IPT/TIG domain-containing protein [Solirubrobacteraceae bacterium]
MSLPTLVRRGVATLAVAAAGALSSAATASAIPVITGISPTSGGAGTVITISGSDLGSVQQVQLQGGNVQGGMVVPSATYAITPTSVKFPAPTWAQDTVTFRVFSGGSLVPSTTPLQFSYGALPSPVITSLSPASGPTTGGGAVYVTGKNFSAASSVTFGGLPSTSAPQVVNDTTVIAFAPAHAAGAVDVAVTTPSGTTTKAGAYTYLPTTVPLPTISRVSPQSVWSGFGGLITITGTNFTDAKSVTIGGRSAGFVAASSLTIYAFAPGLPTGTYPVVVTGANGASAASGNAVLQYKPPFS